MRDYSLIGKMIDAHARYTLTYTYRYDMDIPHRRALLLAIWEQWGRENFFDDEHTVSKFNRPVRT